MIGIARCIAEEEGSVNDVKKVRNRLVFFFFQAEDGIRDHCVTGVQTCALPISLKCTNRQP